MTTDATSQEAKAGSISERWFVVGGVVVVLSVASVIALVVTDNIALLSMLTVLYLAFTISHGALRYGLRAILVFLVAVVVIGWSYESLSIETGFPFGDYYYTSEAGAKIGQVPIAIMPSYFAFGYLSWTIASVLLGKRDNRVSGSDVWVLPLVSSFVMVMWDVCMDPVCSTIMGEWIWEDGGAYFGVPLTNFFGWFLTVFTFYIVFAVYLRFTQDDDAEATVITTPGFWILPIFMYLSIAVDFWGTWLKGADEEQVTDQAGQVWQTDDILGSVVLVSVFTMIFVSILGLVLIGRDSRSTGATVSATPEHQPSPPT